MNAELALVLALLVSAIVMFAVNKPRLDAVALIMLVALPFTGARSIGEVLAGFSDPNIVPYRGLERTGDVDLAAEGLKNLTAGAGNSIVLAMLFAITVALGMFISNPATAALMAPVAF